MIQTKKFISPGGWFSLEYPLQWSEFEDEEGSFLFYNPEKWSGNFRISANKDRSSDYAREVIEDELKQNEQAILKNVGSWKCAVSCETFMQGEEAYTSHFWVTGYRHTSVECSFTVKKGASIVEGERIVASLDIRDERKRYPCEVIPVRIMEICEINTAYEWTVSQIKKVLKKDFTDSYADLERMQEFIQKTNLTSQKREAWQALGMVLGVVLNNEIDGMTWVTIIDGKHEFPALRYDNTDYYVYPRDILVKQVTREGTCNLKQVYEEIKQTVEKQT